MLPRIILAWIFMTRFRMSDACNNLSSHFPSPRTNDSYEKNWIHNVWLSSHSNFSPPDPPLALIPLVLIPDVDKGLEVRDQVRLPFFSRRHAAAWETLVRSRPLFWQRLNGGSCIHLFQTETSQSLSGKEKFAEVHTQFEGGVGKPGTAQSAARYNPLYFTKPKILLKQLEHSSVSPLGNMSPLRQSRQWPPQMVNVSKKLGQVLDDIRHLTQNISRHRMTAFMRRRRLRDRV